MSNVRMSGSPVVPVCRGGYVSEDNPLPVSVIGGGSVLSKLDPGGYTVANQNGTFISGSGYKNGWKSATPGWQSLFSATNQRVRLLGVGSEANQIFGFQKSGVFTLYFPCNVIIDLVGLQTGSFNVTATEEFCSVVNSSTVGILVMYWVYS